MQKLQRKTFKIPTTDQKNRSPVSAKEKMTRELMRHRLSDLIERRKSVPMLHDLQCFHDSTTSLVITRYRRSYATASCGVLDVNRLENLLVPHVYSCVHAYRLHDLSLECQTVSLLVTLLYIRLLLRRVCTVHYECSTHV